MRTCVVITLLFAFGCESEAPKKPDATKAAEPRAEPKPTPKPEAEAAPAAPATPEAKTGPVLRDGELDTSAEAVGPIRQGMSAGDVVAELGEPDAKPKFEMMEATGEFVAEWPWKSKGLSLSMAAQDAQGTKATVSGITCSKTCAFGLPWGLKIGSSRADVEAIYGKTFDPDFTNEESFVAGSVYGGTFYSFESGKVVGLFIGAGAE